MENKEQFDNFLKMEFNLLLNNEFNRVINDINDEIKENEEEINDSIDKNKMLFSNYREIVLYLDASNNNANEPLDLDYVTMYGLLGDAYFRREMFLEAKNAFLKAISLSPSNIVLIQRLLNTYARLNDYEALEELLFKTFKFCYTKDMLIEHYLLLIDLFKHKKDYKSCVYIYYLLAATFSNMNDYVIKEIYKMQEEVKEEFMVPTFEVIRTYLKDNNIPSPMDLATYYYSIYAELIKKEEYQGALDFINSSNELMFDKKNIKEIKKIEKILRKN